MKLTVTIESDNDAFEHAQGRTETAYLLRKVAGRIESLDEGGPIIDANGNTVGSFTFTPSEG